MNIQAVETFAYDLSISSHDGWSTVQGLIQVVYMEAGDENE